jgi:glutamate--cysteine ligase
MENEGAINPSENKINQNWIKRYFSEGEKPGVQKIGIEAEKIGIRFPSGESVCYTGKTGFLAILGKLYEELGWNITKQKDHYILQMQRGGALMDLESDGRIELAGAVHESIHDLAREFRIHHNEISEISAVFGVSWLGCGYHPISWNDDIEYISDGGGRRDEMAKYFEQKMEEKNDFYALAWTKKTAGIHVNLDYTSEEDFGKKSKTLWLLTPFFQAMFANSAFSKGEFSDFINYRSWVTQQGMKEYQISEELFYSDFLYEDWIDFIGKMPALFFKRGEKWIHPNMSFREFLDSGEAIEEDFHVHMKSMWSDLRLRHTLEIRCFDSLPPSMVPSIPAFIKGLAYDEENLNILYNEVNEWNFFEYEELKKDSAKYGLQAEFKGKKLIEWAKRLLSMSEEGLKKNQTQDIYNRDESIYLEPIKKFIFLHGKSPAEWTVEKFQNEWGESFHPLFTWWKY